MRLADLGAALVISATQLACVSELSGTVERRCPESAVELHAAQTGLEYASCGTLEPSADCVATPEQSEMLSCFGSALAACSPARLDVLMPGAAGTFWKIHLVEPNGRGGCRSVLLIDDRGDPFAPEPGVSRVLCDGPALGDVCSVVSGGTCTAATRLCAATQR
jgi:hypothetical protein